MRMIENTTTNMRFFCVFRQNMAEWTNSKNGLNDNKNNTRISNRTDIQDQDIGEQINGKENRRRIKSRINTIYTSDVPKGSRNIKTYIYADDTAKTKQLMIGEQAKEYLPT